MSSENGRVLFAAQNHRFNVEAAKQYGDIEYVFNNRRPSVFASNELVAAITERLVELDYDPRKDYIGLTGSTIMVAYLLMVASWMHPGVRVLVFDSAEERYLPRQIPQHEAVMK